MAKNRRIDADDASGGGGWLFALGAGAGLALGVFLLRRSPGSGESAGGRLMREARRAAERVMPGAQEGGEWYQPGQMQLEDAVVEALAQDELLGDRDLEVGALEAGVIELSGSVGSAREASRAVALTRRVAGVTTVLNRIAVASAAQREAAEEGHGDWGGRVSGMGRRRQGYDTDPDRPDDAQHMRERALEASDLREYEEEDISYARPRLAARPGHGVDNPTHFAEDELDNQTP